MLARVGPSPLRRLRLRRVVAACVALHVLLSSPSTRCAAATLHTGDDRRTLDRDAAESVLEVLWDTWGIPHIYGESVDSLAYGQGWAQAANHGNLLLRLFAIARGRSAEYFGGLLFTLHDVVTWSDGIPQRAAESWRRIKPTSRSACNAYGRGFTDYVEKHREEFDADKLVVLPITGEDTYRHTIRFLHIFMYTKAKFSARAPAARAAGGLREALAEGSVDSGPLDGFPAYYNKEGRKTTHMASNLEWDALYSLNLLSDRPAVLLQQHERRLREAAAAAEAASRAEELPGSASSLAGGLPNEDSTRSSILQPPQRWSEVASELLGSNGWAINQHKADGNGTKLLINPHLPYIDLFMFMESHSELRPAEAAAAAQQHGKKPQTRATTAAERREGLIYGSALIGMPAPVMAFNGHLGWTHTVSQLQPWTSYRVARHPESDGGAERYWFDGEWRRVTSTTHTFLEKIPADGSFRTHKVVVERTVHGPLFAKSAEFLFAERLAWKPDADLIDQYLDVSYARNMDQFVAAWSQLNVGCFHVVAASGPPDDQIYALYNGWMPKRPHEQGGFADWAVSVNGSSSATLWHELHAFADLPSRRNPESGFVQNANESPWSFSLPFADPADYAPYTADVRYLGPRPKASIRLLQSQDRMSLETFAALKHSGRVELATPLVDDLVRAARSLPTPPSAILKQALLVLDAWDRQYDAASKGAILFLKFLSVARQALGDDRALFREQWTPREPLATPRGLAAPERALQLLEQAARARALDGELDEPYGDRYRVVAQVAEGEWTTLPGNGGSDAFRNTHFFLEDNKRFYAVGGDTTVIVVEWTPKGPRAYSLLSYGNASQGKHRYDQMELYSQKRLRRVWLHREEIEANLERRDELRFARS